MTVTIKIKIMVIKTLKSVNEYSVVTKKKVDN